LISQALGMGIEEIKEILKDVSWCLELRIINYELKITNYELRNHQFNNQITQ
jgi:hypothetical protein